MSIKVSIVLPYYNTPEIRFDRCIKSVMSQTYRDLQIIVVDDGSSKESANRLDTYQSLDNRILIIHKNNEGSAIARNTGLEAADGEYAMFVDSDDYLFPWAVEEAIKLVEYSNSDIVIGLVKKYPSNVADLDDPINSEQEIDYIKIEKDSDFESLMNHILGYPNRKFEFETGYVADGPVAKLFKTSLGKSSPFSGEPYFSDDTIWNMRLLRRCKKAIVYGHVWYGYIIFEGSKTRGYRCNCPEEYKYRNRQQKELCDKLWPGCKKGIARTIWGNTGILCRTCLFHPLNKMTEIEKISIFIDCTGKEEYRWALKNISFDGEKKRMKRFIKELDRFFVLAGFRIGSYLIWKSFTRRLMRHDIW